MEIIVITTVNQAPGIHIEPKTLEFYVSSSHADSSFITPSVYNEVVKVDAKRLDDIFDKQKKIKLLKLEAEGAEPEVLAGSDGLLQNIEYISADLGFERGPNEESTIEHVTNYLLSRDFELVRFKLPRVVALFRNKNYSTR